MSTRKIFFCLIILHRDDFKLQEKKGKYVSMVLRVIEFFSCYCFFNQEEITCLKNVKTQKHTLYLCTKSGQ